MWQIWSCTHYVLYCGYAYIKLVKQNPLHLLHFQMNCQIWVFSYILHETVLVSKAFSINICCCLQLFSGDCVLFWCLWMLRSGVPGIIDFPWWSLICILSRFVLPQNGGVCLNFFLSRCHHVMSSLTFASVFGSTYRCHHGELVIKLPNFTKFISAMLVSKFCLKAYAHACKRKIILLDDHYC